MNQQTEPERGMKEISPAINVGDLVMLVRGHSCILREKGGLIFKVTEIVPSTGGGWRCHVCGEWDIAASEKWGARRAESKNRASCPVSWLKRINPPGLTEESKEELSA